ncbi:MAG: FIST C-terminal domain-containing protein [Bacilli bacterium]|nr:FIST C-terminal domain-containing protein [Bacilli bacterium]
MKTKIGYSNHKLAFTSSIEAASMANIKEAKLGLVFTSPNQEQDQIIKGIKSLTNTPIIGCTSSMAIMTHHSYENEKTGYTGIITFSGDIVVGVAGKEKRNMENPREIGKELALEALKEMKGEKPNHFFMTATPGDEEEYMQGIQDIIGSVPVFGGTAADNDVSGNWKIICENRVISDGCAVALIKSDTEIVNVLENGYNETGQAGIITGVHERRELKSIDNVDALRKYSEWTKFNEDDLMGNKILSESIFDPLGVKDPIGRLIAIRHPMFAKSDGTINVGGDLVTNTAIIHMNMEPRDMLESIKTTIEELGDCDSYFLVHCGGRRLGLSMKGLEQEIFNKVKEVTKDKEVLMVFTFGEYGTYDHSANTVGGLSLSFTGFKE